MIFKTSVGYRVNTEEEAEGIIEYAERFLDRIKKSIKDFQHPIT